MNRHNIIRSSAMAALGFTLLSGNALAQQKSFKGEIARPWILVSAKTIADPAELATAPSFDRLDELVRAPASIPLVLAQAAGSQTVQPIVVPPPQLLPSASALTTCTLGCDTQAMSCQNTCVVVGPVATPNPAGTAPCNLNCTTQQLVCKQLCSRQ